MPLHRNFSSGGTIVVAASDSYNKSGAAYICDGTDDDVEIQAAIDSLPVGGGKVVLLEGIYTISATVTVDKPCNIKGAGLGITIIYLDDTSNVDVFTIPTGQVDVTIRDLTIDANHANNATDGNGIFCTNDNFNCVFENLEIQNCREHGIFVDSTGTFSKVTINNCDIHDCLTYGITLDGNRGTIVTNTRSYLNTGMGVDVNSSIYCRVSDNEFYSNTQHGIYVFGGTHNTFTDNQCYYNTQHGVLAYQTDHCIFSNSNCSENVWHGIILQRADNCIVDGNRCDDAGNGYDGIQIYGNGAGSSQANYNLVVNNSCINPGGGLQENGIYIRGGANAIGNIVMNNQCLNNDTEQIQDDGTNTVIKDNAGYIHSGEVRTASGPLIQGNANAIGFAWNNPETEDIIIKKVVVNVTTAGGTGGSHLDVGIADDAAGTNRGTEFFDDLLLNSAIVHDSWAGGDGGTQTKWVNCQDSASATDDWIVGQILDANAASLVGSFYIEYVGV